MSKTQKFYGQITVVYFIWVIFLFINDIFFDVYK